MMCRGAIRILLLVAMLPLSVVVAPHASAQRLVPTSCSPAVTGSTASFKRFVSANNDFGFRLLGSLLGSNPSGNAFISPTSVSLALGMTYDGARSGTASSMARALGLHGMTQSATRMEAASLLNHLQASSKDAGLSVANSLWARSDTRFRSAFLQNARRQYGATVRTLDFTTPQAPIAINRWVSCATHGKIAKIIDRIPPRVILYLMNAVYFQGDWAEGFNLANTRPHAFTTGADRELRLHFMSRTGAYSYYKGPNFQMLRLPYVGKRFNMVVVQPDRAVPLASFSRRLTAATWNNWTLHMRQRQGFFSFPRFSLTNDFLLNGALGSLGMGSALSNTADFSGMCVQGCRISDVRHKTYLAVNEKGTVAAAATSVSMEPTSMPQQQFQMIVDHPFILSIEDSSTGSVLFVGQVGNPTPG